MYCGLEDTEEHATVICDRWGKWRKNLEEMVRENLDKNSVVAKMLKTLKTERELGVT